MEPMHLKSLAVKLSGSLILFAVAMCLSLCLPAQSIKLVTEGKSQYKIIADPDQPRSMQAAATLSQYLEKMTGAKIPVLTDNEPVGQYEILVGTSKHVGNTVSDDNLSEDGYIIKTQANKLIILGKGETGTQNGVFAFLEDYLDCKMYSSDVVDIPKKRTISLQPVNKSYAPAIKYRDLYYRDTYDSLYTAFNRIDHFDAGGQNRKWGEIWSSSFMYVIPEKVYFKTHPEYFALNKGVRNPKQLCLTNESLFNEYLKNFKQLMQRYPKSKVWSVAANDILTPNYCQCDRCQAINKREGTPMGTLLNFVNRIAEQMPDKIIATQAYLHFVDPPKTIKPRSNVMIVYCGAYDLDRARPYTTNSKDNVLFRQRLDKWLQLTSNIRIWDYVVNYFYLMSPFPNFQTFQENIKYFSRKGIKDIFEQGNISTGGDFPELRGYLLAKLLWNPNIDFDATMNEFLNGYYGDAGPYIRKYIDAMEDQVLKSNIPLGSRDHPHKHFKGYLSPANLVNYNKIFDQAEGAVKNNPAVLERVKVARLPLMYAMLEMLKMTNIQAKQQAKSLSLNRGAAAPSAPSFKAAVGMSDNTDVNSMLEYFTNMCKKHNIQRMAEASTTVDAYKADFTKFAQKNF